MDEKVYQIGEAAKIGKIRISTIRFYEKTGLFSIPCRTEGGYRIFSEETMEKILFIQKAKNFGFSLQKIKKILEWKDLKSKNSHDNLRTIIISKVNDLKKEIEKNKENILQLQQIIESNCPISKSQQGTCASHKCQPSSCPIFKKILCSDEEIAVTPSPTPESTFQIQDLFELLSKDTENEIYIVNLQTGKIIYSNLIAQEKLGYSKDELLNIKPSDIKRDSPKDYIQNMIIPLVNNTEDSVIFEANHYRKNGSKYLTQTVVKYFSTGSLKLLMASVLSIE